MGQEGVCSLRRERQETDFNIALLTAESYFVILSKVELLAHERELFDDIVED